MAALGPILKSDYDFEITLPPNIKTFHRYLLEKTAEHISKGRTDWLLDARNGKNYTFSDVEVLSRRVASFLYKRGLRKGQIVIYTSHDCSLLYFLLLGVLRANGIVRAVYSEETTDTIVEKIIESHAQWIICDKPTALDLHSNRDKIDFTVEIFAFSDEILDGCTPVIDLIQDPRDALALPKNECDLDDIALILPTSGTTGSSKGAATSHRAMLYRARMVEFQPFTEDPTKPLMLFGKPTHASGAALIYYKLINGQRVVTSPYSKQMLFSALHDFKCEAMFCVAPLLQPLVYDPEASNYDLSSLKYVFMGGAIAKKEFVQDILRLPSVLTVSNNMGMTESSILATSSFLNSQSKVRVWDDCPFGSIGKLVPGAELQIRDIHTGLALGSCQKGELCYKLSWTMSYYLNNAEDTEKTLKDGWLITGDYGYYDEKGFIYIEDRIKDTFLCHNGNHISPSYIESKLKSHPAVKEACVVPDEPAQVGNPRGFVTLREGYKESEKMTQEILEFANGQLADYQKLKGGLFIIKSFPMGKTGKILRRVVGNLETL